MDTYRDKMIAGWLGRWSRWRGAIRSSSNTRADDPESDVPVWKPEMINHSFEQDDLYVEMTFLKRLGIMA